MSGNSHPNATVPKLTPLDRLYIEVVGTESPVKHQELVYRFNAVRENLSISNRWKVF